MGKTNLSQKCIQLFFISFLLCLYAFDVSASKPIPTRGQWKEGKRTSINIIPVSASIDGTILTIECTSGRSDISISVINSNGFTYETTVPASEAYFITINLADAPEGDYQLILTNQWGGYLTGSFEI